MICHHPLIRLILLDLFVLLISSIMYEISRKDIHTLQDVDHQEVKSQLSDGPAKSGQVASEDLGRKYSAMPMSSQYFTFAQ